MASKDFSNSTRLRILLSTFICSLFASLSVLADNDGSYTVSVYQVIMADTVRAATTREEALAKMNGRLDDYGRAASLASKRKSKMLVFPEYGLYVDLVFVSRRSMVYYLEEIPDPKVNFPWTPCDLENTTDDITVQKRLSCMAKEHRIYIVANIGEREACNRTVDYCCPSDGRYQFSTNVVYASNGTMVSRYRKTHLSNEPNLNSPLRAEHEVFDTPFGRFASIISLDIRFRDTVQDLIKDKGVRNIILPNMWFNIPPFSLSVPYHASVAWATKINLISASLSLSWLHAPNPSNQRTGGSGIYNGMSGDFSYSHSGGVLTANMTNTQPDSASRFAKVPKRETPGHGNQTVMTYKIQYATLKTVRMIDLNGSIGVCHNTFCCGLDYEFESEPNGSVSYLLGAGDNFEFQFCSVCVLVSGKSACEGIPPDKKVHFARFKRLRMFANNFLFPYVFPQAMVISDASYKVLNPSLYYSNGEINLLETSPLHSINLLGRNEWPGTVPSTSHPMIAHLALVIGMLVLPICRIYF